MRTANVVRIGAAIVLAVSLAACGSADDDDADAGASTEVDEKTSSADGGTAGTDGGARSDCPLSAEEVSEVLGTTVEKDAATCSYRAGGSVGNSTTSAFVEWVPGTCNEATASGSGYDERLDGLGVEAYTGSSAEIFVCADAPFVVGVNTSTGPDLTAAEALATKVLEGG